MIDKVLAEYSKMATVMESFKRSRRARLRYHLLADAVYWSDEVSPSIGASAESCLRMVLRYRTTLILGQPDPKWLPYWEAALRAFPKWIGFAPERCRPDPEIERFYREVSEAAISEALELFKEDNPDCEDN